MHPGPDHQALRAPRCFGPGVRLQTLKSAQRPAQEEVEPASDVENWHVNFAVPGGQVHCPPVRTVIRMTEVVEYQSTSGKFSN